MAHSHRDHLANALEHLRIAKHELLEEITNYPAPIAGCDAQFNYLLSERQKISEAILVLEGEPFIPTPRNLERNVRVPN